MMRASKKTPLLLLPGTLDPSLENRLWLDCAFHWHRSGGQAVVAAPTGSMSVDFIRSGIPHTPLSAGINPLQSWNKRRAITELLHRVQPVDIWFRDLADWRFLRHGRTLMLRPRLFLDQPVPYRLATQKLLQNFLALDGRLIATSAFVATQMRQDFGLAAADLPILPPVVDTVLFDPARISPDRALRLANAWRVPENAALFLHGGKLQPDGGQISFFHAIAQTGRRDIYAVILGREAMPGYRGKLLDAVNHYGLAGQVVFCEDCLDLPAALWLAQGVVYANRAPMGADPLLLAAQAMGRPVLVSDTGANLELVEPGNTAWIYPASNAQALHDALLEILGLGEKARVLHGIRVRDWVMERFPYAAWRSAMLGDIDADAARQAA